MHETRLPHLYIYLIELVIRNGHNIIPQLRPCSEELPHFVCGMGVRDS